MARETHVIFKPEPETEIFDPPPEPETEPETEPTASGSAVLRNFTHPDFQEFYAAKETATDGDG